MIRVSCSSRSRCYSEDRDFSALITAHRGTEALRILPPFVSRSPMPTKKKLIVLMGVAFANFLGGFIAALEIHQGFAAIAFGVPIVCGVAILLTRCSRCGHSAWKRERRVFGVGWSIWGGCTVPNECANRGKSFQSP